MMVVPVTTKPLEAGTPVTLFAGSYDTPAGVDATPNYDVTADGQTFFLVRNPADSSPATEVRVILNWFEELKRLVPTEN
jgi:hypothetical protein